MLVANKAERTLDHNSDGTWILTYCRLNPGEDAHYLIPSMPGGSRLWREGSSCFDEISRRINLRYRDFFCVEAVELGSERSSLVSIDALLYEIPHMQLPSPMYLVFASSGVGKGPL
jgi:hypothetical protein